MVDLNTALAPYGNWQSQFSHAGFAPVTFKGKIYAVPILGSQPAMVYYNKPIFSKLHLTVPTTWAQMMSDAAKIKSAGLIPFALGNSQGWPGLIWEELLVDRLGEAPAWPASFPAPDAPVGVAGRREGQHPDPASGEGRLLQPGYSAVDYSDGEPNALMYSGKAAMQVMLSFGYGRIQTANASSSTVASSGGSPSLASPVRRATSTTRPVT